MKIASRFLLPLELFTALLMLSWGLSGWIGGSGLWTMLKPSGQNTEWGLWLCGLGGAQLLAAGAESVAGRDWRPPALLVSVSLRFWLAFLGIVTWFWVCYVVFTTPGAPGLFSLILQAPVALAASTWIAYGNRKVACVLDPGLPTRNLQTRILQERRRGWPAEEDQLLRGPH